VDAFVCEAEELDVSSWEAAHSALGDAIAHRPPD
jgi:hypothetical protein